MPTSAVPPPPAAPAQLVGIDVGGTFTDFVWLVEGRLQVYKAATTPDDQSRAILSGLDALGVAATAPVVHGTTVATNALLERGGARTALLTTEGFADVLVIGRQNRPHLYALSQHRPPPLVPEALRLTVPERLDHTGHVLTPLDENAVRRQATVLAAADVESVAVVFLFSFRNPAHEQQAAALLAEALPGVPLSLSSDILPEHREYERTATTVVNAYVRPLVARYLARLEAALGGRLIRVMQSNGGAIGLRRAAQEAARLVLSGPAGGVVGAFALAQQAMDTDAPPLLTFDMGGTSTDVALCPGRLPTTAESVIAGLPLRLPTTDIHTVGAGGGSIARVDAGGSLRVGPESAGAVPGPACYGHGGTTPTVTDANLVLGYLDGGRFLGGQAAIRLDADAAHRALTTLGTTLGLSAEAAALGVVRIANATMERALRRVSVEQGYDPRDYVLVPFGGAGPLHACALAEALGLQRILVPPTPGVLSAFGLLMADIVYDAAQSVLQPAAPLLDDPTPLQPVFDALAAQLRATFTPDQQARLTLTAHLDLRYAGQSYELSTPLSLPLQADHLAQCVAAFHDLHNRRYGHARPEADAEVVTLRLRGTVPGFQPHLPTEPRTTTTADGALLGHKDAWFHAEAPTHTACYDRDRLRHGHHFAGPALVYQYDTTLLLPPGWHARVDAWRNLWLTR